MSERKSSMRSLQPTYIAAQHQYYVDELRLKLTQTDEQSPLNIALTGHYGSGKSSVLLELQRQLRAADVTVIDISLSSLGVGDGRLRDSNQPFDKTNLIQKEIVKQVLYRRAPRDTPDSRFNRLDVFDFDSAAWRAGLVALLMAATATLAQLPARFRDSIPSSAWDWLSSHVYKYLPSVLQWSIIALVLITSFFVMLWVQRLLHQRYRVSEVTAGPTKIALSQSSASYFDEFLDEIVYFFQVSKTTVVIFEDLDRFEDPYIFETLRELNLLLNQAAQTGSKPIQFVYAIRDSIFETLGKALEAQGHDASEEESPAAPVSVDEGTDGATVGRLTSTNRTKFFDLIIPVVPFISHRTSTDLISEQFVNLEVEKRPSPAAVEVVSSHVTDMRLVKNIANEYDVFQLKLLGAAGVLDLSPDRLFATIVYKNHYLQDYEAIRQGHSRLDDLYRAYREWIAQRLELERGVERDARLRLSQYRPIALRARGLGERLQAVLSVLQPAYFSIENAVVVVGRGEYRWADLTGEKFWTSVLNGSGTFEFTPNQFQIGRSSYPKNALKAFTGEELDTEAWAAIDTAELAVAISESVVKQREIASMTLHQGLMARDKFISARDGQTRSLADEAAQIFGNSSLAIDLVMSGMIDENFLLYVTQFPGQSVPPQAMNFILRVVQPNTIDIDYSFLRDGHLDEQSIEAVLRLERQRLLSGRCVYNVHLFDYLLAQQPEDLREPVERIAAGDPDGRDFLRTYLLAGSHKAALVTRLATIWPDVFEYLLDQIPEGDVALFLDAAFRGGDVNVSYKLDAGSRHKLQLVLERLDIVREPASHTLAQAFATICARLGLQIDHLSSVAQPLRDLLIEKSLYRVDGANLRLVFNLPIVPSLDVIKASRPDDVYAHVARRLDAYVASLDEDSETISAPERFLEIITDAESAPPEVFEVIARRATPDALVSVLDDVPTPLWRSLTRVNRVEATAGNGLMFVDEYGFTALVDFTPPDGFLEGDSPVSERQRLAIELLRCSDIVASERLRLVKSLVPPDGSLAVGSIDAASREIIPELVQDGLVEDTEHMFSALRDESTELRMRVIEASKNFAAYMTEVDLSAEDITAMLRRPVASEVLRILTVRLDLYVDGFKVDSAEALLKWLKVNPVIPDEDALPKLIKILAQDRPSVAIDYLGLVANDLKLFSLLESLVQLGKPYDALTVKRNAHPRFDRVSGLDNVIKRLKADGYVTSWDLKRGHLIVHMKQT